MLKLRSFLESISEEIVPFLYVRDPWSWSISLRQEEIHRGGRKGETQINYTIPLRARLEKLEAAFGRQMMVAPYLTKPDGFDVVSDFLQRFNLDGLLAGLEKKPRLRTSMNLEAAALMLQVNQLYPVFDEQKAFLPDPARALMNRTIQNSSLSRTPLHISRKTARKIYKDSKADLDYVENKYFSGKRIFSDLYKSTKFTEFDDTISLSVFSKEDVTEYLLSCLYSLSQELVDKVEINDSTRAQLAEKTKLAQLLVLELENQVLELEDQNRRNLALREQLGARDKLAQLLGLKLGEQNRNILALSERLDSREKILQDFAEQLGARNQSLQYVSVELVDIKSSADWKLALLLQRIKKFIPAIKRRFHSKEDLAVIGASGLFNVDWYLEKNPDVAARKVNPALHYLLHGGFEGRDPGQGFDSTWYMKEYADVSQSGLNPLVHYLSFGQKDGRRRIPPDPEPVPIPDENPLFNEQIKSMKEDMVIPVLQPPPAPPLGETSLAPGQSRITRQILRLSGDKQEKLASMQPPVFIFGPPRSGSTFLVEAMNRHESIFITNELRLMSFINDIHQLVIRSKRMEWNLRGKYKDEFLSLFRAETANLIRKFYYRKMEGKKIIWGDKHPHYADQGSDPGALVTICSLFPKARFIHIYRHPRQVINSMTTKKWWNFESAVDLYKSIVTEGRKLGKQVGPERYLEVKYEFLVEQGKETVGQICEFLNIPVSERWLNYMEQQERLRTPYCDPVTEQDLIGRKTVVAFPKEQEQYLKKELGKLMDDLGYF